MEIVWTKFNPQGILGRANTDLGTDKVNLKFDALDIFLIQGSKYELVTVADEIGILESSKSYLIIFTKTNFHSHHSLLKDLHGVYLWRGAD